MKTLFLDFCPKIRHVLRKNKIEFITFYRCHTHFSPFVRKSWFEGGEGQNFQVPVWARSILVNGILYLGLFSPLDITSSKYRNGEFNFVSCSNLSRSLGIMYHMLIHGPKRFWPVPCVIGGFIRGTSTSTFRHKTWWWWWWWWGGVGTHSTKHSFTGKRKKMSIAAIKRNKFYFIFP